MEECSEPIYPHQSGNVASLASASPRARVPGRSPKSGAWLHYRSSGRRIGGARPDRSGLSCLSMLVMPERVSF